MTTSNEIKLYRKKPVEVQAMRLVAFGDFTRAVTWIKSNGGDAWFVNNKSADEDYLIIGTIEGNMEARTGSWVIRGIKGEFYPCTADIFAMSYELVEMAPA